MSTKADIIIEGEKDTYIYIRHSGYPAAVMPFIKPLIREYFYGDKQKTLLEFLSERLKISLSDERYTEDGFGLHCISTDGRDPWREYEYFIRKDGCVDIYNKHSGILFKGIWSPNEKI